MTSETMASGSADRVRIGRQNGTSRRGTDDRWPTAVEAWSDLLRNGAVGSRGTTKCDTTGEPQERQQQHVVDYEEDEQSRGHGMNGDRRHRIGGAELAIDDPGLPACLGGR